MTLDNDDVTAPTETFAMLDAGATAYLSKGGPPEDLIKAIRRHYVAPRRG